MGIFDSVGSAVAWCVQKKRHYEATKYYEEGKHHYYSFGGKGKDLPLAIINFDKALELDPTYVEVYYYRGETYKDMGLYEKAIADFKETIKLNPKYALGYSELASIHIECKEYKQAIQVYDKLIDFAPEHASYYYNRGIIPIACYN